MQTVTPFNGFLVDNAPTTHIIATYWCLAACHCLGVGKRWHYKTLRILYQMCENNKTITKFCRSGRSGWDFPCRRWDPFCVGLVLCETFLGDAACERSCSITAVCPQKHTYKSLSCPDRACFSFESADLEDPKYHRTIFEFITRLWKSVNGSCNQSWCRDGVHIKLLYSNSLTKRDSTHKLFFLCSPFPLIALDTFQLETPPMTWKPGVVCGVSPAPFRECWRANVQWAHREPSNKTRITQLLAVACVGLSATLIAREYTCVMIDLGWNSPSLLFVC